MLACDPRDLPRILKADTGEILAAARVGDDVFVFGDGDRVSDFVVGQDRIDLTGLGVTAATFASLVLVNTAGSGVTVTIGARTMRLDGVDSDDLTAASFILAGGAALAPPQAGLPTGESGSLVTEPSLFDPADGFLLGAGGGLTDG